MHSFEYAVIRVVPCVERQEFLNVGVVLYCRATKFLGLRYTLNESRLLAFDSSLDMDELRQRLWAFEQICAGNPAGGTIGKLAVAERFRWLTATRSTVVQTSPVHPGLSLDPDQMLEQLFDRLVR